MKLFWIAPLALLLSGGLLLAGVVYEIETKDHDSSGSYTTEVSVEGKNLKMGISGKRSSGQGDMIYRGKRREMVVIDHDNKSYMVMDGDALKELAGTIGQAMSQVEQALKNVPEGQRAMMEKMMKERMPKATKSNKPMYTVRKTGKRAKKEGYPCVKYEVLKQGQKVREMWVTDWKNIDGSKDARQGFEDMAEFFQDILDAFSQAGNGALGSEIGENMFAQMKEMNGFPVVTNEFGDDGSLESESTLRSAKRRTLDPADFEPPSGYKRRSMMGN